MDDIKNQLRDLIENNKIDEAIKLLKQESAKKGGELDHIIISLSSRYKRYKKDSLMGLEARDQEFSKIVADALKLVKVIDDPSQVIETEAESSRYKAPAYSRPQAAPAEKSNKYVQMGIGGLAVIGLIALIVIFSGDDEPTYDDGSTNYDEPVYTDPNAGQGTYYDVFDISGRWSQVAVSFGENCPDCIVDIAQSGNYVSVSSNSGLSAELTFLSDVGYFEGNLYWEPNDPGQAVQIYFDEDGYLIMNTSIQGGSYIMYYGQ